MYLISAYFDEKTNRILQGYMDQIAAKTGNTFMTENHVPPHMTISAIEARNVEVLLPAFESLRGNVYAGEIRIVSVGQLLPYVFYATPVLNEYLMNLSKAIHDAVSCIPETAVSKYYQPMSWLPHITLGKTLDRIQMQTAFEVMQERFSPMAAQIEELGLAKVNPHEDVMRLKLGLN